MEGTVPANAFVRGYRWRLPPPETPLIWKGPNHSQLCELPKDPKQSGHRSIQHTSKSLLFWARKTGKGHTLIPLKLSGFQARVRDWATQRAVYPIETPQAKPGGNP